MASYNRIIMVGNLTRDPELKQVGMGNVCRMSIASNRQFKNKQTGAAVQEVCFIDVDVWGPQADSTHKYLRKGSPVLVEGRLKFDTWKDTEGQTRSKHSIVAERVVFLGSGQASAESNAFGDSAATSDPEPALPEPPITAAEVAPAKKARSTKAKTAEAKESVVPFVDEPPFSDDLPF